MTPCMGGWCAKRDQCPHHHATESADDPRERLCLTGQDGIRVIDASPYLVITVDLFGGRELSREMAAA